MKKLLYTLLLGLVVISCNKDDMGAENISVLAPSQEVSLDLSDAGTYTALLDILVESSKNYKGVKSSSAITAKGDQYIILRLFTSDGKTYLHFGAEDAPELCNFPDTGDGGIIYNLRADNKLGLELIGSEIEVAVIDGDWSWLFAIPQNNLFEVDSNVKLLSQATTSEDGFVFTF